MTAKCPAWHLPKSQVRPLMLLDCRMATLITCRPRQSQAATLQRAWRLPVLPCGLMGDEKR